MGKQVKTKESRSQLRQVVQEILPELVTKELFDQVDSKLNTEFTKMFETLEAYARGRLEAADKETDRQRRELVDEVTKALLPSLKELDLTLTAYRQAVSEKLGISVETDAEINVRIEEIKKKIRSDEMDAYLASLPPAVYEGAEPVFVTPEVSAESSTEPKYNHVIGTDE